MKRTLLVRIATLAAAITLIASCDQRTPVTPIGGGGGGGGGGSTNLGAPTVSIDTLQPSPVNIGDSILIAVRIRDDSAIANLQIQGLTVHGSVDLGTLQTFNRYQQLTVNGFRTGLRDTTIRRYLKPATPIDTTLDSLVVIATASDGRLSGADTVVVRVVTGPRVNFVTPTATTQMYAGGDMSVIAHAIHPDGVASITIRAQSQGTTWPTPVNFTQTTAFPLGPTDTNATATVNIPTNAPVGGRVLFTASGIDVNGKPGSQASITLTVRGADTVPPLVTQTVSPRIELTDSVLVRSSGSSATTTLGVIVKDSVGVEIRRTSIAVTPFNNVSGWVVLPLTNAEQGRNLRITAFATDRLGRTGYAVPTNVTAAQPNPALAWSDTTVVVYGRTYPLPNTTVNTVVGDVAVDTTHANVFVTNINSNRLEVWQGATRNFATTGIPVGSQPWGLAFGNSLDTLFVANSGGTNISRVYIGAGTKAEVLSQRILTRNTYAYIVTQVLDENTGKITLSLQGPISYSDRPQYVAVSAAGRVYYSTRPTSAAPAGTIRWLDPALPVPDPQQIWQYGSSTGGGIAQWVLFNTDSVKVLKFTGIPNKSDIITIWDHPYGQSTGSLVASDSDVVTAVGSLGPTSDAELVANLDIATLALTDTTFLGVSGDRNWLAFGEGNTGGAGRIMMVNDPSGTMPGFFSPGVTVRDLIENANERVYGVAVDSTGATVASHGDQSYFATINNPFHLRLQGKYDSFDNGAGVAFHPGADGYTTAASDRLAFVGSQSGYIEIIDIAYFLSRGKLAIKGNLYGPLRASRPFPGDPPGTILKLFGLTKQGLVVIDLTAADIRPAP